MLNINLNDIWSAIFDLHSVFTSKLCRGDRLKAEGNQRFCRALIKLFKTFAVFMIFGLTMDKHVLPLNLGRFAK